MLDVATDLDLSGGLGNAATVIAELTWENDTFMDDVLAAPHPFRHRQKTRVDPKACRKNRRAGRSG